MAHLASSNDDAAHLRVFCSREKLDVDEPILLYAASILGGEDAEDAIESVAEMIGLDTERAGWRDALAALIHDIQSGASVQADAGAAGGGAAAGDGAAAAVDDGGGGKPTAGDGAGAVDDDAAAASSSSKTTWTCPACTYANAASRGVCEMCDTERPLVAAAQAAAAGGGSSRRARRRGGASGRRRKKGAKANKGTALRATPTAAPKAAITAAVHAAPSVATSTASSGNNNSSNAAVAAGSGGGVAAPAAAASDDAQQQAEDHDQAAVDFLLGMCAPGPGVGALAARAAARHVLRALCGGNGDAAARWLADHGDFTLARADALRRAHDDKAARARADAEAEDAAVRKRVLARYDEQCVVGPGGGGGGGGGKPAKRGGARKIPTKGGSRKHRGKGITMYRDGKVVSRDGARFTHIPNPKDDYDGGSRGRVKSKGKRGVGWK